MIAQHHFGKTRFVGLPEPVKHGRAVAAPIAEVADKDGNAAVRMVSQGIVSQMVQQGLQRGKFAVYVPDDV